MSDEARPLPAQSMIERVTAFTQEDLHAFATPAAIIDGGGFGWVNPPGIMALRPISGRAPRCRAGVHRRLTELTWRIGAPGCATTGAGMPSSCTPPTSRPAVAWPEAAPTPEDRARELDTTC
jgi:hypothetical protein